MDIVQEYGLEITDKNLGSIASDGETTACGSVVIDWHDITKQISAEGMIIPPQGIRLKIIFKTGEINGTILGVPVTACISNPPTIRTAHPAEILFRTKKGDILYGTKTDEGGMTTYKEDDRPVSKPVSKRKTESRPSVGPGTRDFFYNGGYYNSKMVKQKI